MCEPQEYRCSECGKHLPEDEVVWADDDGTLNTDTGKPWCTTCAPEEPVDPAWESEARLRNMEGIGDYEGPRNWP